jgi:ABC-type sugar transport system substrate-binding protein
MFNKKIVNILLVSIFVLIFSVVCMAQETETFTSETPLPIPNVVSDRPIVLGYQMTEMEQESSHRIFNQVENEVEARGWKLIANTDADDVIKQRAGLENFINQGVDAIVIFNGVMEAWEDLIISAREKGIGFYSIDTGLSDGVIVNTTQQNGVVGAKMTYYGVDKLTAKGGGNVLVLNMPEQLVYRQRAAAAKGLLETEWANIEMIGYEKFQSIITAWKDAFDITQNYLAKYDNDIQWIFAPFDGAGWSAAKAVVEAGLTREDCFITGIDGGSNCYAEIRKGSPFVATISQPFELYTHDVFEVINQIQIEGIAPGAEGSMVPASRVIYGEGVVTDESNLPEPGTNIHEVFAGSYYDPNNTEAWYNWGEPYIITAE